MHHTATLSRRGRNCKKYIYSQSSMQYYRDNKWRWQVTIRNIYTRYSKCSVRTLQGQRTSFKRCVRFLLSRSLTNEVNATTRSRAKREALLMKPVGKFGLPVSRTDINADENGRNRISEYVIRLLTTLADATFLIQWIRIVGILRFHEISFLNLK